MSLREIIDGKKAWRAHTARIKALPKDYRIVYNEIQTYIFRIGAADTLNNDGILAGVLGLFEEGAAAGKGALDVTGDDVAAFCDELIENSGAPVTDYTEEIVKDLQKAVKKAAR